MDEGFAGFEDDVADKAVAYDDVHVVIKDVEAFDEARVVDYGVVAKAFEVFVGFVGEVVAFAFFGADAEEAYAGVGEFEDDAGIPTAEDGVVD